MSLLDFVEGLGACHSRKSELRQAVQRGIGSRGSGDEVHAPVPQTDPALQASSNSSAAITVIMAEPSGAWRQAATARGSRSSIRNYRAFRRSFLRPTIGTSFRPGRKPTDLPQTASRTSLSRKIRTRWPAIIVEPIGNTGGIITPTEEYFQILRSICDRYNVTLIFDEVITGFAKTGRMFAAQTYGVTPDIMCTGKGISGGAVPLGAMIAREDMAEAFSGSAPNSNFAHGHTFAGNPLACAVGIAVLEEILEQDLCAKAERLGDYLESRLACLKKLGVVREIRGKGVLRGVEFTDPHLGKALKKTALDNGIILRIDPSWFAVSPPFIAE